MKVALLIANAMEFNLRLRKVCPRCNTLVHAVCGCGHAFAKAQCTTNESVKRKRASESEKETDKVRRARRAWLGILYIHDTCFPKNNNTALICHNLHNQCSRRGFALQCFSLLTCVILRNIWKFARRRLEYLAAYLCFR